MDKLWVAERLIFNIELNIDSENKEESAYDWPTTTSEQVVEKLQERWWLGECEDEQLECTKNRREYDKNEIPLNDIDGWTLIWPFINNLACEGILNC